MKNSNEFKNSGSTLHDSQLSMSPIKSQTLRSPVRSPIRSPLRTTLRSPIRFTTQNFYSPNRYTSPLRQRTQNILNLTSERLNRSLIRSPESLRNTLNTSLRSSSPRIELGRSNNFSTSNYVSYEEENFISYLRELLDLENQLERAKCDNIIKADFNVDDAFSIFEVDRRGYLSDLDLKYGLNSLDIFPTQDEIALLIKRFNRSREGILR
jgi:Ca2+-binding EF-hand superfamily protein